MLAIDDSVGGVMTALDNTPIAFAGDNGLFMGEDRRRISVWPTRGQWTFGC